jgi:hypothetical protein
MRGPSRSFRLSEPSDDEVYTEPWLTMLPKRAVKRVS